MQVKQVKQWMPGANVAWCHHEEMALNPAPVVGERNEVGVSTTEEKEEKKTSTTVL